ncbi:DUF2922 domain-containing protein [Peptoniphilus sp. KCTC 25270]|uniref:DUF2922 domain-containing protein n=1 Tax=Peptoniphilus sp. KCTC 25270 TaxID=2897414 RepID=UPI001E3A18D7|nr:DUF2922 domain-containing protein [Peptoniphilus sp. KCTC 25270]MCD1148039.1 DUF2922 domain-containing protein [Peptoniphilus sp. KCTC 25270]
MEKKVLVMKFRDAASDSYNLRVDDPKEGLSEAEVRPIMESIVSTEVFRKEAPLAGVEKAEYIVTTSNVLFDVGE